MLIVVRATVKEGLFLYTHNVSPYDGGVFHQVSSSPHLYPSSGSPSIAPTTSEIGICGDSGSANTPPLQAPLLLALFSLIPTSHFHVTTALLYITLDLLAAHALVQIAESHQAERTRLFKSPRTGEGWDSWIIAAAYLFNPLIIATCIGRPTSVFTSVAILCSVANAVGNKPMSTMMGLGVATYLSMYPALLVGPMVLLGYDRQEEEQARTGTSMERKKKAEAAERGEEGSSSIWLFAAKHTAIFLAGLAWLLYISYILTGGSWEFISSTYGVQLLVPDLTPNVGLWWYFFIEMFDSFREFFLGVFWLHLGGYVGGLCIRLRKQPLFVVVTMMGIFAIFKPYPTIGDTGLWLSMLPLYRHVFGCEFACSGVLKWC